LGGVFRKLAEQKECRIDEGHLHADHVHLVISIPPEIPRIAGAGIYQGQERHPSGAGVWRAKANYPDQGSWARGYFVSTMGRDETSIRDYISNQERKTSGWIR
jgi:putative transposase